MTLLWVVAAPFIGSVLAACLPAHARNAGAWLAGVIALFGLVSTALMFPTVDAGLVVRYSLAWVPVVGLDFVLRVDGFAWVMAMLVFGIGALVILYARYYMPKEDPVPRFFAFLLAFMGAMLGIVVSGNLIQILFFWELTSLFSFLLIGYWHNNATAREGARMALLITASGGLLLFAGLILIGHIVGSFDLDVVLASGDRIRNHALYIPILVLVLIGAFTKSAQFPFHFWLPHAMAAPTPVSAYLHSATMVKAGVFLLARFWPVLAGTNEWFWIVATTGLTTMLLGAFYAMFQQDLKGLLAYSTISHLGLTTLLLGLNTAGGVVAAIFHMMNHALFKASLFMAAGVIDHETGTRDIRRLSGLIRKMPITAALAMVASAAMAGVPLLNGFLSKEMFFAETLERHATSTLDVALPYLAVLAGAFSVAYSIRFIHGVFFGPAATNLPREPHEPPGWMRFPIELLVLACLLVGIIPAMTIGPLLASAVYSVLGAMTPTYSLQLWHGFNTPFVMSLTALGAGTLFYLALRGYAAEGAGGPPLLWRLEGKRMFERVLVTVTLGWGTRIESLLGTRRLQPQLWLIVALAFAAGFIALWTNGFTRPAFVVTHAEVPFIMMWIVGSMCAIGSAFLAKDHRFAALVLMSAAGVIVCFTFVWLSAPDLAITQLLVEIVTTVLLLLGLRWLPSRFEGMGRKKYHANVKLRHMRDLPLAVASGLGLGLIAFAVMTQPRLPSIAREFIERAYPEGGGKNVVNVILVDFRGLDTMGEITVLAAVALTVYALLRRFRPAPDSVDRPLQQQLQQQVEGGDNADPLIDYMYISGHIMHWVFPIIAILAVFLFMRGHDLPGGGFSAGVALSIAFILQYMARGTRWVEARLDIRPLAWIATGLTIVVVTGTAPWFFDLPFLTTYFEYRTVPVIGRVPVASAMLFDLGVFSLVVGAVTLALTALAHQSIRGRRAAQPPVAAGSHEEVV